MKSITPTDPSLVKLVERQMRNWELVRDRRITARPRQHRDVAEFICISRQAGAGAHDIAVRLGKRLGWPVFDKELLHVMAGDDSLREQIYASMDERDLSWCEQVLRPLMQPGVVRDDYFHRLSSTVLSLARQGTAVFVGRGADLILPREIGLRVRIVAPVEERIRQFSVRQKLDESEARTEIERIDEERAFYIRNHFHVDVQEPGRYDLVINLSRISASQAVELILSTREILAITPDNWGKGP